MQTEKHHSLGGRVIVVVGPPCSGKGTQCKLISQQLGALHLSLGDLFRDHASRGTDLGREAKKYMDRGSFVPDDMATQIVRERLSQPDVAQFGCLLDGFPRTRPQAAALIAMCPVTCLLLLEVPDEVLVRRAPERRLDLETGNIYNLASVPPPNDIRSRLTCREHDADQVAFQKRLEAYHANISQVLSAFQSNVRKLDGTQPPRDVFAQVSAAIAAPEILIQDADRADQPMEEEEEDDWPDDPMPEAPAIEPSINIAPCANACDTDSQSVVTVSMSVPEEGARTPVDVCCVIDISGSMGQPATAANEADGPSRENGLSVLDIVKHAVKTVMCVLKDGDRLALVAFDEKAEVVFELREMQASARELAMGELDKLRPRGQTNLWDGIRAGMDALRQKTAAGEHRSKTLLVLTDGQPNVVPPRGHLQELELYKDSNPDFSFQMNTFGFGYDLDSELLLDLAVKGNGTYAFIPDAVIVGTTFVNSIANVLTTWTQSAQLHLMPRNGAAFAGPVVGETQVTDTSWGLVVSLGPLQLGQSRAVAVPMLIPPGSEAYIEVVLASALPGRRESRVSGHGITRSGSQDATVGKYRSQTVAVGSEAIKEAVASHDEAAQNLVSGLAEQLKQADCASDARLATLRADIDGRMTKALNGKDRFNRWGKHYLRALIRAHQLQLCTNFMDPGLQVYGGALFKAVRGEGDAAFLSLPAPRPAKDETTLPCDRCGSMVPFCDYAEHTSVCGRGRQAQARPAAPPSQAQRPPSPSPDMQQYYAGSGGG